MSIKPSKITDTYAKLSSSSSSFSGRPFGKYLASLFLIVLLSLPCAPAVMAAEKSTGSLPLTLDLSGNTFEVSTNTQSVPVDGKFLWQVKFIPSEQAQSAQVIFEVKRPNGSMVFRRTQYINDIQAARKAFLKSQNRNASPGSKTSEGAIDSAALSTSPAQTNYTQTLDFTRDLAGFSMAEGLYTVTVEASVDSGASRETAVLNSSQFVYNPKSETLNTVLGARFSLPPLRDAKGVFITDPAGGSSESLRLALKALIESSKRRSLKPTVFISPLLLEGWLDIADGYQVKDLNEKPVAVSAGSVTAKNYAETLDLLKAAAASDTISIGILGFADPDLSKLVGQYGPDLIDAQYQRAISTLETAGFKDFMTTAPLGNIIGSAQLERLAAQKITAVMLPETSFAEKTPRLNLFASNLKVFKVDAKLSSQLTSSEKTSPIQELLFQSFVSKNNKGDFLALLADVNSVEKATAFTSAIDQIEATPWLHVIPLNSAEKPSAPNIKLTTNKPPAPTKDDEKIAKSALAGLGASAAMPTSANAMLLRDKGLTAQNATPVPSAAREAIKALRLDFADTTLFETANLFKAIDLKISPVTLSGNSGVVPITINNSSKTPMTVVVTLVPGPGMTIEGDSGSLTQLLPQETFLQPTVTLTNRTLSKLTIVISAGSYTICEKSVDIRASYIDTIVIVAIVTLLGLGLLVYIYKRVKRSSPPEDRLRQTSERAL